MDHSDVARFWDSNADAWTLLSRRGYDRYRDHVNTPAFMAMLPEVSGLRGLDIGCGEGHNTRLLAARGARMTAIDVSQRFIDHARSFGGEDPPPIHYLPASAVALPFPDQSFDFATAFMSLMDLPEQDRAIAEAYRVLRGEGFLQFSISHPCFATPRWEWQRDREGNRQALRCGDYFRSMNGSVEEWIFSAAPPEETASLAPFRIPRFNRILSGWLNLLIDAGFRLERFAEPFADDAALRKCPELADTRIIAYFLIARCRK